MQCSLGKEVGYQVRFDDCTSQVRDCRKMMETNQTCNVSHFCVSLKWLCVIGHGGEVHDGWLYAEGDFGKSLYVAVQRGYTG